jgi:predicted Zn-dependent peptidase
MGVPEIRPRALASLIRTALTAVVGLIACASPSELSAQAPGIGPTAEPPSLADALPVRTVTLANGMRVLLLPRSGAPTVSFVMQIGIGGVHESPGSTGIAHLLEHMLFKGTESIGTNDVEAERALFTRMDALHETLLSVQASGDEQVVSALRDQIAALEDDARALVEPNEYHRILTRAGAQGINAMTTSESTTYFVELPSNRMELFFVLEADRMANPVFREFYSERDVVMEERRMRVDTSPGGTLYEAHLDAAFRVHPYGRPVVGYMADLETLTRPGVAAYYRRFYGPGNAVLAVVGRFDPDRVERWAHQYFEPIAAGEDPAPVTDVEPEQRTERRVEIEWDAEPLLRIGWHVPATGHPDGPAIAMLGSVLTGGRTTRLYRRLVTEDRLAASVFSSTGPGSLFPSLFQIDITPLVGSATEEIEEAIYEEIARLAADGPTAEELARVRNQVAAGAVRRVQSNLGLAFQLADSESLFGDWRETFRRSEAFGEVSADDVRRVASRYLTAENRTVATLMRTAR